MYIKIRSLLCLGQVVGGVEHVRLLVGVQVELLIDLDCLVESPRDQILRPLVALLELVAKAETDSLQAKLLDFDVRVGLAHIACEHIDVVGGRTGLVLHSALVVLKL